MSNTDCLVLCIESQDHSRMYIFYDSSTDLYEIRASKPYSFSCTSRSSLVDFINYTLDQPFIITMYHHDDLPDTSVDVTFDLLDQSQHTHQELFSYRDKKIRKSMLTMLRNITNYY